MWPQTNGKQKRKHCSTIAIRSMSCQSDQFLRQLTTVNNHVSLAKYSGTGIIILIQIIIEYHIRVLPLDEYKKDLVNDISEDWICVKPCFTVMMTLGRPEHQGKAHLLYPLGRLLDDT